MGVYLYSNTGWLWNLFYFKKGKRKDLKIIRSIFDIYGTSILVLLFVILFIFESKYQLRKRVQSRWKRIIINFLVALPSFALLRLVFIPLMVWLTYKNEQWQFGLNYLYVAPGWLKAAIVLFLLDYSNYLWHIVLHRMPLMWRFHLVHHTDLDLDLTTSFRFHFFANQEVPATRTVKE